MRAKSVPTMSTLSQRNFHQFIVDKTIINTSHRQLVDAIEQLIESLQLKREYFTQEYLRQIVNFILKTLKNDLVVSDPGALQLIEQLLSGCAKINKSNTANFLLRPFERDDIVQAQNWYRISIYEAILRECTDEQVMDGLHGRIRFYIYLLGSHQHPQWFIKTALRCVRRISELFSQNRDMPQKIRIQRESYLSNIQNQLLGLKLLQSVRTMSHGIAGGLFAELLDSDLVNQDQKYKLLQELQDNVQYTKQRSSSAPAMSRLYGYRDGSHLSALGTAGEPWHGPGARPRSTCPIKHIGIWTEIQAPQLTGVTAEDAADTLSIKRNLGIEVPREAHLTASASKNSAKLQFIATPPRHLAYFTLADKFVGCSGHATGTPMHKTSGAISHNYNGNDGKGMQNSLNSIKRAASVGCCPTVTQNYQTVRQDGYKAQHGEIENSYKNNVLFTPVNHKPSVAERFGFGSSQIRKFVPSTSQLLQNQKNDSDENQLFKHTNNSGIIQSLGNPDDAENDNEHLLKSSRRHSIETLESMGMESFSHDYDAQKVDDNASTSQDQAKNQQTQFVNLNFISQSLEGSHQTNSTVGVQSHCLADSSSHANKYNYYLEESSTSEKNWNIQEIEKIVAYPPVRTAKTKENPQVISEQVQKHINSITIVESPAQEQGHINEQTGQTNTLPQYSEQTEISEVFQSKVSEQPSKCSQANQSSSGQTTSETLGTVITWAPGVICAQLSSENVPEPQQTFMQKDELQATKTVPGTSRQNICGNFQKNTILSAPTSAQSPVRNSVGATFFGLSSRKEPGIGSMTTSIQGFSPGRSLSVGSTRERILSENQRRYLSNSYIFRGPETRGQGGSPMVTTGIPVHHIVTGDGLRDSGLRNTAFNGHLWMDYDKYRGCIAGVGVSPYRGAPSATGAGTNSVLRYRKFTPPELSASERAFFEQAKRVAAIRHSQGARGVAKNKACRYAQSSKDTISQNNANLTENASSSKNENTTASKQQDYQNTQHDDYNISDKKYAVPKTIIPRSRIPSRCGDDEGEDDVVDKPGLLYIQLRNGTELPKDQILDVRTSVEAMFTLNHGRELSFGCVDDFCTCMARHRPFLNVFTEQMTRAAADAIIMHILERRPELAVTYLWQAYLLGYMPNAFYFRRFNRLRLQFKQEVAHNEAYKSQNTVTPISLAVAEKMRVLYLQWRGHKEEEGHKDSESESSESESSDK